MVIVNVKVEEGLRATERVACSGSESVLDECVIEGMGEGGSCKLEEDIVSISCVPDSWATCEVRFNTLAMPFETKIFTQNHIVFGIHLWIPFFKK